MVRRDLTLTFLVSMFSNYKLIENSKYNFLSAGFELHHTSEKSYNENELFYA